MRIRVDHEERRQLTDGGPWIFWRQGADGAREGLVLELLPCDNRQCECREVRVTGRLVGPALAEIEAGRGGLALTYRQGGPAASGTQGATAFVSFETGDVQPATGERETAETAGVLAWIGDELDGELLDRLYDEWLHAKAWRRREAPHESAWAREWMSDTARMVGWYEAFPDSRQDMYEIDGSVSLALDHYCMNPGCTCREVRVALLAPRRSRGWNQFGDIVFDLDSPGATRLNPWTSSKARLVTAVRSALEKRYDVFEHFSARLARLREVGAVLRAAAARTVPAPVRPSRLAGPGRNAPCPCGSGRKYKKCCLKSDG